MQQSCMDDPVECFLKVDIDDIISRIIWIKRDSYITLRDCMLYSMLRYVSLDTLRYITWCYVMQRCYITSSYVKSRNVTVGDLILRFSG